jgi:hypothetical protein
MLEGVNFKVRDHTALELFSMLRVPLEQSVEHSLVLGACSLSKLRPLQDRAIELDCARPTWKIYAA